MAQITNTRYSQPEVLVDTQWLEEHLNDKNLKIAEVDYDAQSNYEIGHIPNSVLIDWKKDINNNITRDILTIENYQYLINRIGIKDSNTSLIMYSDYINWFAEFAFWVFKYYGYKNIKLLNGRRKKWLEEDRPISKDIPNYHIDSQNNIKVVKTDNNIRVFLNDIKNVFISRRKH